MKCRSFPHATSRALFLRTNSNSRSSAFAIRGTGFFLKKAFIPDSLKRVEDLPSADVDAVSFRLRRRSPAFVLHTRFEKRAVDVAFPVLHGTYGEDGSIQGLFRVMRLPFVGCDVTSSAVGMDKDFPEASFERSEDPERTVHVDHAPRITPASKLLKRHWVSRFSSSRQTRDHRSASIKSNRARTSKKISRMHFNTTAKFWPRSS